MVLLSGGTPGVLILILTFCLIVNGLVAVLVHVLLRLIPAYAEFMDIHKKREKLHYYALLLVLYILVGIILLSVIS